MILTGLFLYNLLCVLSPCDPSLESAEVRVKKSSDAAVVASPTAGTSSAAPASDKDEMRDSPMVVTTAGGLQGYTMFSSEGREIFAYEGIPYAEPPVGHRRFRAPVPKKPWLGIRKAHQVGPECLQLSPAKLMRVTGDEDCLYLNVYTRQGVDYTKETKHLPVIVYIHGGAYYFGNSAEYGPSYLLNHDVILVTINYRLGVLGFLSTGDSTGPGNYGLKDQALGLKWISENIKFFGGDPKHITIVGHGSSGAAVHLHSMSPLSRNLFRSGVSLSGSAFTNWAVKSPKEAERLSDKLAGITGCGTSKRSQLMDCLREKNPVSLVSAQFRLLDWVPFPLVVFAPVVEPESEEAFLPTTPEEYYGKINATRQSIANKPWVFGITADEGEVGLLFLRLLMGEWTLRYQWTDYAPAFLDFKHTANDTVGLSNRLASLYFGGYTPQTAPISSIGQLFGDRHFLHGVYKAITIHSRLAPTYAYFFQYKGKYNPANRWGYNSQEWGVGNTEDLYYYFNSTKYYPSLKRSDKEYQLSHVMTTLLANFADSGTPLMSTDRGSLVQIWESVDPDDQKFLRLDKEIQMVARPLTERFDVWEGFDNDTKADLNMSL